MYKEIEKNIYICKNIRKQRKCHECQSISARCDALKAGQKIMPFAPTKVDEANPSRETNGWGAQQGTR